MSTQTASGVATPNTEFMDITGTDFLELYVGNAKQAAYYFKTAFGFQDLAQSGLETGKKDQVSIALQQGKIRLVLTAPLSPKSDVARHLAEHGDGVKIYAITVKDARRAYEETVRRGAKSYMEPHELEDEHGKVVMAGIYTYGETVHLFVEREAYNGAFLPGFVATRSDYQPEPTGLQFVDHCVGNVGWGEMNKWVKFYEDVMGFTNLISFDDKDISTTYTALMSKVMSNGNGRVKFPINEPAEGKKKSQIEEYLDFYGGPGIQHIALHTDDILSTIRSLKRRGVEFLQVPDSYYDDLKERVGEIDEEIESLRELGILVDRDDEGYLLQLFTKPLEDRPTLFIEIIQRKGAKSFGKGNFKALFEAIEREQELRGTL